MSITKVQEKALSKMESGKEYSCYNLQESITTMDALVRKKLVSKREEIGSMWSPRTSIMFKINENNI